jgi:hypothetical protein
MVKCFRFIFQPSAVHRQIKTTPGRFTKQNARANQQPAKTVSNNGSVCDRGRNKTRTGIDGAGDFPAEEAPARCAKDTVA